MPVWRRPRVRLGVLIAVTGYVVVATFRGRFVPLGPGLDQSWIYALNQLPHSDLIFGRDVVFTFGPLGYLLVPRDIGSNLLQAAVLWIVSQAVIAAVIVHHYRRTRSLVAVVAFALAFTLATAFQLTYEYQLLMIVALLLSVPPDDARSWRLAAPAAAFFAALLLFIKLTAGLTAFSMVAVAAIVWAVWGHVRARRVLLFVTLPYGLAILTLGLGSFNSPASFLRWLRFSAEIVAGYGSAMSLPKPGDVLYLGLLAMGVVFLLLALLVLRPPRWLAALSLAPFAFVGFRYAFARHQGRYIFGILLALIAVVLLAASSRRRLFLAGATLVVVLGTAVVASTIPECRCGMTAGRINMARGWSGLGALLQFSDTRHQLAVRSEQRLLKDRLPADWVAMIRSAEGGVDVVPSEIAFVAANDLPWNPNPVLQTYHAYTESLDRWTAQHFAGKDSPGYLLVQFGDIDVRHPMWGAPAMWRSILSNYEVADTGGLHADVLPEQEFGQVLLLRRRDEPAGIELRDAGRQEARIGEWIDVPTSEGLLFASVSLHLGLRGSLESLLWHVDAVNVNAQFENGQVENYRLLPRTSGDGLLVDLPVDLTEFIELFGGEPPSRLVRFRVRSGVGSYEETFDVTWRTAAWSP